MREFVEPIDVLCVIYDLVFLGNPIWSLYDYWEIIQIIYDLVWILGIIYDLVWLLRIVYDEQPGLHMIIAIDVFYLHFVTKLINEKIYLSSNISFFSRTTIIEILSNWENAKIEWESYYHALFQFFARFSDYF